MWGVESRTKRDLRYRDTTTVGPQSRKATVDRCHFGPKEVSLTLMYPEVYRKKGLNVLKGRGRHPK